MSSSSTSKIQPATKYKSKIPMSYQKTELGAGGNGLPADNPARTLNAKSRSAPNANVPAAKLRQPSCAHPQRRVFDKKCASLKKLYNDVKEELSLKQKHAEKMYKELTELREKLITSGVEDVDEIDQVTFSLVPMKSQEKNIPDSILDLNEAEKFIESLKPKLDEMANLLLEMCRKSIDERAYLMEQVREFAKDPASQEEESAMKKLETFQTSEDERLTLEKIEGTYQLVTSSVATQVKKFLNALKTFYAMNAENWTAENREKLEALSGELEAEKRKSAGLKERKCAAETQLNESRTKLRKLEEQISGYDERLKHRQKREETLEQTVKELKINLEKAREASEARIKEMKKDNDLKEKELLDLKKENMQQLKDIRSELEAEINKRQNAEENLKKLQEKYQTLEEESKNLCEMTCDLKEVKGDPPADSTDNEVILFNELKIARNKITELQSQMEQFEKEKEHILELCKDKMRDDEDNLESQLILQIENNKMLNNKYDKLKQDYEKIFNDNLSMEKQLLELKNRIMMKADEVERDKLNLEIEQFVQRTKDLESTLTELRDRNRDLEKSLTSATLRAENKDREIKQLRQLMQKKFQVFNLIKPDGFMKGLDDDPTQKDNEDLNKLIREYNESLCQKQSKIESLKKTSKYLMDQENRSQKTRTNLENRIAVLELENRRLKNEKPRRKLLGFW